MKKTFTFIILTILLTSATGHASGILVPTDKSVPPLAIKHQRVDIRIKDGIASARIEQVFKNSVKRNLEATYVFPLPANAAISDFAMYINGKRMSGELVEKDEARRIYEDIVRRMKDPGLLEHIGGQLFKIRVFPVPGNGEQKIELEFSQALSYDAGLYKYVYPLKTGEKASRTLEDFTVSAKILSKLPIKNVYSPSHKVGIDRKGENEAVIGFEEDRAVLDRDFVLYYSVSDKDFGVNLLTHAVKGKDGFFMMMLAPRVTPKNKEVIKKDIVFVLDTSGSMAGKKMDQARNALEYCVRKLNDGDRFNIVRFSTEADLFKKDLVEVSKETRAEAMAYVHDLEARGGTAIHEALDKALAQSYKKDRPAIIAFLTDGKPTIGVSQTDDIVSDTGKWNKHSARIFVFGVGENVNTHLLDKLAGQNGGLSEYVLPDEDIEVKLSSFSDKMSFPVLSNVRVAVDKLKVKQQHPRELPDLFGGQQITVLGRYAGHGDFAIRLTGEVNGHKRQYVYEGTFPEINTENEFVPRLWATRRVGYLLDEIRLHGESKELKDEVLALSREYGIMTPYTSYLVLENNQAYKQNGIVRKGAQRFFTSTPAPARELSESSVVLGGHDKSESTAPVPVFDADADALDKRAGTRSVIRAEEGEVQQYMRKKDGADAVRLSQTIREYKEREYVGDELDVIRHAGTKVFRMTNGRWVDTDYRPEMKTREIEFGSEAYFEILKARPELKKFLALGEKVTVVLDDGSAIAIK